MSESKWLNTILMICFAIISIGLTTLVTYGIVRTILLNPLP